MVRCNPGEDGTNGFFVSCFVRDHDPDATLPEKVSKKTTVTGNLHADTSTSKRKAEESGGKKPKKRKKKQETLSS